MAGGILKSSRPFGRKASKSNSFGHQGCWDGMSESCSMSATMCESGFRDEAQFHDPKARTFSVSDTAMTRRRSFSLSSLREVRDSSGHGGSQERYQQAGSFKQKPSQLAATGVCVSLANANSSALQLIET